MLRPAPDARELVAALVHDLRNPLAALAGNLALLREELGAVELPDPAARCLDDADALTARALALVSNLIDADALARGALEARRAPARLGAEVDAALATVAAELASRALIVERAYADDLVADIDAWLLRRVLGCLFDNAVRYAPRGGRVVVRAAHAGAELELAVGNTGPALTDAERARLFERDYRSAERAAGARRGRGLGLYFCRLVAEAHGGTIAAGPGAELPVEFVLRLPA